MKHYYNMRSLNDIFSSVSLLIFIGCGLGGVARYWISNFSHWIFGKQFPIGTLVVNVSGSLIMGFLFVVIFDRFSGMHQIFRPLLLIGFLGGYTTFSSFSIETIGLIESGSYLGAMLNIVLSVVLCVAAAWAGVILGRQI